MPQTLTSGSVLYSTIIMCNHSELRLSTLGFFFFGFAALHGLTCRISTKWCQTVLVWIFEVVHVFHVSLYGLHNQHNVNIH